MAGSYNSSTFIFLRNLRTVFPQWLSQFTILPTAHKGSLYFTAAPAIVISCLFDVSHSNRHEVISHCGLDLHFPND